MARYSNNWASALGFMRRNRIEDPPLDGDFRREGMRQNEAGVLAGADYMEAGGWRQEYLRSQVSPQRRTEPSLRGGRRNGTHPDDLGGIDPRVGELVGELVGEKRGALGGAGVPGGDLGFPMALELEDLVERFHAALGGFRDSIEEKVEPSGEVILISDSGEAD